MLLELEEVVGMIPLQCRNTGERLYIATQAPLGPRANMKTYFFDFLRKISSKTTII